MNIAWWHRFSAPTGPGRSHTALQGPCARECRWPTVSEGAKGTKAPAACTCLGCSDCWRTSRTASAERFLLRCRDRLARSLPVGIVWWFADTAPSHHGALAEPVLRTSTSTDGEARV